MPLPDSQLTITTGREGGMYFIHAQNYAKRLSEHGITLKILPSGGSGDNLSNLRASSSPAQVGFVQGGFASSESGTGDNVVLKTVGVVDIEPVWVFSKFLYVDSLMRLQGTRLSVGPVGSGSRVVAMRMLAQVRLGANDIFLKDTAGTELLEAMRNDEIDAAIFVAAPTSPVVQALLKMPGVYLAAIQRSAAVSERLPYLDLRFVASNSLYPAGQQPAQDMVMLSTLTSVLVRDDLNAIVKRRLAHVVKQVHEGAGPLHRAGEFPHLKRLEFPSDADARKVLRGNLPWVEQHLDVQASQWVYRLLMIGLPLFFLATLICHSLPTYFAWRLQARINRWYGELKYIEDDLNKRKPGGLELARTRARLGRISEHVRKTVVPNHFVKRMIVLHQHLELVLTQINQRFGR